MELQHVGHSQHGGLGGFEQAAHFVEHHGRGDDMPLQHQLAGDLQRFQADLARHQQQFHKAAIAAGLLEDAVPDGLDGDR